MTRKLRYRLVGVCAACCLLLPVFTILRSSDNWVPSIICCSLAILLIITQSFLLQNQCDIILRGLSDGFVLTTKSMKIIECNRAVQETLNTVFTVSKGVITNIPPDFNEAEINTRDASYRVTRMDVVNSRGLTVYHTFIIRDISSTSQLVAELRTLATQDLLTGLFNRGTLDKHLAFFHNQCQNTGATASLLMLDIDFFKKVNDTYGHQMGDTVLKQVANTMHRRVRESDICGRYGGEEFCIILPNTNVAGAKQVAEMLRVAVSNLNFTHGVETFGVTISIGISCLSESNGPNEALKLADDNLYRAKETGRNRVVC